MKTSSGQFAATRCIDVSAFSKQQGILEGTRWLLVVKSLDQKERRERMLSSRTQGKFGRLKPRPTAEGLLVCGRLEKNRFAVKWTKLFREPRHIRRFSENEYFLTEMNRLFRIDSKGEVLTSFAHPFFAFLHTVSLHSSRRKVLVTSSGYDAVFELDLQTGKETFRWLAWEHGFNPDEEGVWLAANRDSYEQYKQEGKNTLLVSPEEYGDQGLMTARRSAHPNAAVYDPYDDERSMIVSIGHDGALYRVNLSNGSTEKICDFLSQMPHGLFPFKQGWLVTNTTKGEWYATDSSLNPVACYSFAKLDGKAPGVQEAEWIQQVVPVGESQALALDANRGLIAVDLQERQYTLYQPDENWCIQDALLVS